MERVEVWNAVIQFHTRGFLLRIMLIFLSYVFERGKEDKEMTVYCSGGVECTEKTVKVKRTGSGGD